VGFPTAVYSPKHRSGRCLLDRSIERSARTPPPTLLFLSSLVKEQSSHTRDEEEPQTPQPSFKDRQALEASRRPPPQWPAVDEAVLLEHRRRVNTYFEDLFEISCHSHQNSVFRQASPFAKAYLPLRLRDPDRLDRSENFLDFVRGAMEICHLLAIMARAVD
jgi:hypothetical protein